MIPPFRQCATGIVISGTMWWIGVNVIGPTAATPTFDPPAQAKVIDNFKQDVPGADNDFWRWSGSLNGQRNVINLTRGQSAEFFLPGDRDGPGLIVPNWAAGDWNFNGTVNSSDISGFLTDWVASAQASDQAGDFNLDNAVNSSDISAFLTAWLASL